MRFVDGVLAAGLPVQLGLTAASSSSTRSSRAAARSSSLWMTSLSCARRRTPHIPPCFTKPASSHALLQNMASPQAPQGVAGWLLRQVKQRSRVTVASAACAQTRSETVPQPASVRRQADPP